MATNIINLENDSRYQPYFGSQPTERLYVSFTDEKVDTSDSRIRELMDIMIYGEEKEFAYAKVAYMELLSKRREQQRLEKENEQKARSLRFRAKVEETTLNISKRIALFIAASAIAKVGYDYIQSNFKEGSEDALPLVPFMIVTAYLLTKTFTPWEKRSSHRMF